MKYKYILLSVLVMMLIIALNIIRPLQMNLDSNNIMFSKHEIDIMSDEDFHKYLMS